MGEIMKKTIILIIALISICFFLVSYLIINNNKYEKKLEQEIKQHYTLENDIKYLNKSNLYYIILTTKNLIVLDEYYQEVFKEDANKINFMDTSFEITYRLNQVMFEIKKISKNKITYEYYDIYTNELIDNIIVGG